MSRFSGFAVSGYVDNSRLQEMLKREMDSMRHRTTSQVENERLQKVLEKQLEYSQHRQELLIGENGRYQSELLKRVEQMKKPEKDLDLQLIKLEKRVQRHLSELEMEELPDWNEWNERGNVQRVLNVIEKLSDEAIEYKEECKKELDGLMGKLMDEKCDLADAISSLQKKINIKKQHLQELQTKISNEQIRIKQQNRDFLLTMRPKKAQLEKLRRRRTCSLRV